MKDSIAESVPSLQTLLGLVPSLRAAEQMNQRRAEYAKAFRFRHAVPPPEEEAELLVATADRKEVTLRRPLEERVRRGPRRMKGEKANQKQMACVSEVYTIDRFRRTANEVVDEVARKQRAANRPRPQHKQVWTGMTRVAEVESCTRHERLFIEMSARIARIRFDDQHAVAHNFRLLVLCDEK